MADALVDPTDEITIGEALDEGLDVTLVGHEFDEPEQPAPVAQAELPTRGGSPALPPPCPAVRRDRGRAGGRPHGRVRPPAGAARHRRRSHPPPGVAVRRPDAVDGEAPCAGARDRPADTQPGPRSRRTRSPGATERDRPLGHPRGPGRPDLQPERPAGRTVGVRQPTQRRRLAPDACARSEGLPASFEETVQHHPVTTRPGGPPRAPAGLPERVPHGRRHRT